MLKNYVKDLKHEVCGNIIIDDNKFRFKNIVGGREVNGRPLCKTDIMARINFHTHPITTKSYPSAEDIISTMKQRTPRSAGNREFVFTKWGIWDIIARKKHIMSRECQSKLVEQLDTRILHKFYSRTERGRAEYVSDYEIRAFIKAIKQFVLSQDIDCDIIFTRWSL